MENVPARQKAINGISAGVSVFFALAGSAVLYNGLTAGPARVETIEQADALRSPYWVRRGLDDDGSRTQGYICLLEKQDERTINVVESQPDAKVITFNAPVRVKNSEIIACVNDRLAAQQRETLKMGFLFWLFACAGPVLHRRKETTGAPTPKVG